SRQSRARTKWWSRRAARAWSAFACCSMTSRALWSTWAASLALGSAASAGLSNFIVGGLRRPDVPDMAPRSHQGENKLPPRSTNVAQWHAGVALAGRAFVYCESASVPAHEPTDTCAAARAPERPLEAAVGLVDVQQVAAEGAIQLGVDRAGCLKKGLERALVGEAG